MKRIIFTLMMVLLAATAAQAATNYGFEVAGTAVTSDNCDDITNNFISGTVYYVPSTNTLHMINTYINCAGSNKRAINNLNNPGLKIQFNGYCTLRAQDAAAIRVRQNTTLYAPVAGSTVDIIGVNDCGIYLVWNQTTLTFEGPG